MSADDVLSELRAAFPAAIRHWDPKARILLLCTDNERVFLEVGRAGSVDVTITDPPFDIRTHAGHRTNRAGHGLDADSRIEFAPMVSVPSLIEDLVGHTARWVVSFCALEQLGEYRDAAGDSWVRAGVYAKVAPMPQITGDRPGQGAEGVAIMHRPGRKRWNGGGHAALWEDTPVRGSDHPTPKPLDLMRKLVSLFSDAGELVFDPFAGSGTTLRACKDLGRPCLGVEINPAYCDLAVRMLAQEVLL